MLCSSVGKEFWELFGKNMQNYIWCTKDTAYHHKYIVPNRKVNMRIHACFAATRSGQLGIIERNENSQPYQNSFFFFQDNVMFVDLQKLADGTG